MAAGATALLSGCSAGFPSLPEPRIPGTCRTPDSLIDFSTVGSATLGYEVDRSITTYRADPRFVELLEAWAEDWSTVSGLGAMTTIWSYGAYVDKCDSFHTAGRAFDIAEVEHVGGTVSCRFDVWGPGSATQNRDYWRLAASLHSHFSYTLSHLYDDAHHNHLHVDNAVSQWENSDFRSNSRVQVQMVQGALRWVFDEDIHVTGKYDGQTRASLRRVQASLGITVPLAQAEGWQEFLRGTASAL